LILLIVCVHKQKPLCEVDTFQNAEI